MGKALAIIGIIVGSIVTGGIAGIGLAGAGVFAAGGALAGMGATAGWIAGTLTAVAGMATSIPGVAKNNSIQSGGDYASQSPTYSFGPLQTQSSNLLCRPRIYGKVKCAGNIVWQNVIGGSTMNRIVCFADGEINGFSNVRFNDIPINELAGCSYTAYTGNGTQLIDSRVPGNTQEEKVKVVGGLKYDAYLALTAVASEKVNGGFTVTAEVEGSKIKVYTSTTGSTVQYSNNPAWCILDFLTCYNGCGISLEEIDIQSFLNAAEYCDTLITFNLTGTVSNTANSNIISGTDTKFKNEIRVGDKITIGSETKTITEVSSDTSLKVDSSFTSANTNVQAIQKQPRFTLNLILDVKKARLDWLNDMLLCCRGYITYQGGKIALKIEEVENTMQVFTPDNIITGSEKFWATSRDEKCDIVKLLYIDPDSQYIKVYAQVESPVFQNDQPIVQEVQAFGVTNFKQASRLAWFYLNQSLTCNKFISFQTTKEGLDRTVGDVIEITSTFLGYTNKKMRIINMAEAQEGQIEIVCKEYNPALYSDTLGSVQPVYDVISLENVFAVPDDVKAFAASQNMSLIQFNWQEVPGSYITYEIREGDSWNTSSVLATGLTGNNYTTNDIKLGTHKYWIKAKGKYANYSDNATLNVLVITEIMATNLVVSEDLLDTDLSLGIFTNCYARHNKIVLNSNINWENTGNWQNTDQYYLIDGNWGTTVVELASYESPVYDLGLNLTSVVNINYNFYKSDESASILIEWKYSEDNIIWTDYQTFTLGNYKFRYYKFKVTMNSPLNKPCSLDKLVINVDVPDRDLYFRDQNIVDASVGASITFNPAYVITPAVVANISDGTSGYCVISAKSTTQATIKAYNNAGNPITAKIDVRVKGY
jgi:hypothetical protein